MGAHIRLARSAMGRCVQSPATPLARRSTFRLFATKSSPSSMSTRSTSASSGPSTRTDTVHQSTSTTKTTDQPPSPAKIPSSAPMLKRDQELLQKLLDRDGGSAGISTLDGRYEEGLGPETKKNMFRLI
ncbi:hypothetical protein BCV70DRAFT_196854 [Testicularia cyperi]|uniref:Uncharacterized protein n=1 Tax=Testicularia cyperi TaxID=1882483 RepID=A0A317XWX6_9BASI|nr:hypothetical protein BCV70DRAFT_196854 [Testicularia cyperi]